MSYSDINSVAWSMKSNESRIFLAEELIISIMIPDTNFDYLRHNLAGVVGRGL